ncbi:hypothetical protein [Halocatena marina]|nr:hypothetical protein [Halocatena marina]
MSNNDEYGCQLPATASKQNESTDTHTEEADPEDDPKETEAMFPI